VKHSAVSDMLTLHELLVIALRDMLIVEQNTQTTQHSTANISSFLELPQTSHARL
jgi:hypothetical protein